MTICIDEAWGMTPVEESNFPSFEQKYSRGLTYLVSWPGENDVVVKAGSTVMPSRWRRFVARGAQVDGLWWGYGALELELHLQRELNAVGQPAFKSRWDSQEFLGSGSGYTECFLLDVHDYIELLDEVTV